MTAAISFRNTKPRAVEWRDRTRTARRPQSRTGSARAALCLLETFPGAGYYLHHSPGSKDFFAGLIENQRLRMNDAPIIARLHTGASGTYLWIVNPTRGERAVSVSLSADAGPFETGADVWGARRIEVRGRTISLSLPERDVAVVRMDSSTAYPNRTEISRLPIIAFAANGSM